MTKSSWPVQRPTRRVWTQLTVCVVVVCLGLSACTLTPETKPYVWDTRSEEATGLGTLSGVELPTILTNPVLTKYEKTAPLPTTKASVLDEPKDIAAEIDDELHQVVGPVPAGWNSWLFPSRCGTLVSVMSTNETDSTLKNKGETKLVGFELATMKQLWELNPNAGWVAPYDAVTFGSECEVVINMIDVHSDKINLRKSALVIDGATGELLGNVVQKDAGLLGDCSAAESMLVCTYRRRFTTWDLSNLSSTPLYEYEEKRGYVSGWGTVVGRWIRTNQGFVDVSTGELAFGLDATKNQVAFSSDERWVIYEEALLPGSFDSGQVLRVEFANGQDIGPGLVSKFSAICQVVIWNAAENLPVWKSSQPMLCHEGGPDALVAGETLLLSTDGEKSGFPQTKAFDLATGDLLWERNSYVDSFDPRFYPLASSANAVTTCLNSLYTDESGYEVINTRTGATLINTDEPVLMNAGNRCFGATLTNSYAYAQKDENLPFAKFKVADFQQRDAQPVWTKQYDLSGVDKVSMFTVKSSTYVLFMQGSRTRTETGTFVTRIG